MRKKKRDSEPRSMNPHFWLRSIIYLALILVAFLVPLCCGDYTKVFSASWFQMLILTLFLCLTISVCSKLTDIFSLRKNESGITWCQITILIAVVMWVIGFLIVFDIKKDSRYFLALGIIGTMLSWIFQDTLKGVVAFLHVRLNHLLSIDDWIQVPKYNVDGEVKRITLTTVSVYNWDTTTSSIPTSVLHGDHFVNLRKMSDGRTYGRLMQKNFILDTSQFHPLTATEAEQLRQMNELRRLLPEEEIHEGVPNYHLFRLYLYHWLLNNPIVSQHPRLIVRWEEQSEAGLPLQVYIFLLATAFSAYDWQQSTITEQIVDMLGWFGLRLYQSPSSRDLNQCLAQLSDKESTNRKEALS